MLIHLTFAKYENMNGKDTVGTQLKNQEIATFGPVHLNITNKERSINFWRDIIGLVLREDKEYIELGTSSKPLVVLHPTAISEFKQGFSGLYHLAIHLPNEEEFAQMLYRLIRFRWPISPTDHTMSKSIYLEDPDKITIEFALETPERMQSYIMDEGQLFVLDTEGNKRGVSDWLDVDKVLEKLSSNEIRDIHEDAKIGHLHLYVNDLNSSMQFYKKLGFIENMFYPQFGLGDLSSDGHFKHRIAVNVWQGIGAPQAPKETAGMEYFIIKFNDKKLLENAINKIPSTLINTIEDGYSVEDPAGNRIVLTV